MTVPSLVPYSETYEYFSLPYCQPKDGVKYKTLGMGEVVDANRMARTQYALNFHEVGETPKLFMTTPMAITMADQIPGLYLVTLHVASTRWVKRLGCS